MVLNQHNSILSEQELQLLIAADETSPTTLYPIYSSTGCQELTGIDCDTLTDVAVLTLRLTASPLGSAVILTSEIESSVHYHSLLAVLKHRADITVFWLAKLPSMSFDLPSFIFCEDYSAVKNSINHWNINNLSLINAWQHEYRVGMICDESDSAHGLLPEHLSKIKFFTAQQALNDISNLQLLIINLNTPELRLIVILNNLIIKSETPFLLFYGDMQTNLSHALYNLANHMGFSILASFDKKPSPAQSRQVLVSLFSKVYLKHWVNAPATNLSAKGIYHLIDNSLEATLFPYGFNQEQIIDTKCPHSTRKIVNVQSIFDWFPDGLKRDDVATLIKKLGSDPSSFDLYLTQPQDIQVSSTIFSFIVMARLNKFRIYWIVDTKQEYSIDILMYLPISDIILSESITTQLLSHPSQDLLDFLLEAQEQNVRIGAKMAHNETAINALSLYGVEILLTDLI